MADDEVTTARSKDDVETKDGKRKRKLHTYEKAQLAYDQIKAEKERRREANLQRERERQAAVAASKQLKRDKMKALSRRTKRGQPKLDLQMELLLKKIEKNASQGNASSKSKDVKTKR